MDAPKPNLHFRLMAFSLRLRDLFMRPENVLKEVAIGPGSHILDFGCGPGSYAIAAASLVGTAGEVYALDIHPLAVRRVQKVASRKGLANIRIIQSDCATGLEKNSVDVVLLYDTFHTLSGPENVLKELHRVLRPDGILSFSDHHMKDDEIAGKITDGGLFRLLRKGKHTCSFLKQEW